MLIYAGGLATPPTVTTIGCLPGATPAGTTKLICSTLTDQVGMPEELIVVTGPPPTDTLRACVGAELLLCGAVPSAIAGRTCPTPVIYTVIVWPGVPLEDGFAKPLGVTKMPGAAAETWKLYVTSAYGLPMVRVACPAGISYGICRFTWFGET